MNILILTTHLNLGGIGRYVINLARALAEADSGDKVFVASCGGEWQDKLKVKNVEHLLIPIKTKSIASLKIPKSFSLLSKFLEDQEIDIIHANTRVTQALAYLLHRAKEIPYISTFHGCYRPHLFRRLLKFQGLATIAVSGFVKNHLVNKLGLKEKNIRVIYNGMDIEDCLKAAELAEVESIKKLVGAGKLIGTVSRLTPEKNIHRLIGALPQLLKKFPDIHLVILGQGRQEDELKNQAKDLKLEDKISFLRQMHPCSVIKALDVFISLSQGEPFGFSVIEAQALGIPVIALSSGALKETVQHKVTGVSVNDTSPEAIVEALGLVFENRQLCDDLVISAKKNAEERFSMATMAAATRNLYQEVI